MSGARVFGRKLSAFTTLALAAVITLGCSKDGSSAVGGGLGSVSLGSLPSLSAAFSSASGSGKISRSSVSGTVPTLSAAGANPDQYFWNNLISTINAIGGATAHSFSGTGTGPTSTQRNSFWAGSGVCQMAQDVGYSLARMQGNESSGCYMKKMATTTSSAIVVTGAEQSSLFEQGADDKLVRVDISGGPPSFTVFIKVFGTSTVGAGVYKTRLHFCTSGSVTGKEILTVNTNTGEFTAENYGNEGGWTHSSEFRAFLKSSGGSLVFDLARERSATAAGGGGGQNFKSIVTLDGENQMVTKNYFEMSGNEFKNYSVANVALGANVGSIQFEEGAFKNSSEFGGHSHSFVGAAEFQSTHYVSVNSGTLYDTANAVNLSTDSFYTSISAPSIDLTDVSCSETPGATVAMDFSHADVVAIQNQCESGHLDYSQMEFCRGASIQNAMTRVFTSESP